jgi:hypothetical protein
MTTIGDPTCSFFLFSVVNTPYWLPYLLFFSVFGRQYSLLATLPALFFRFRSSILLIGDPTCSFFLFSVVNTPYWRPHLPFFLSSVVNTPFWRPHRSFFLSSVVNTPYWRPYLLFFSVFRRQYPLLKHLIFLAFSKIISNHEHNCI